MWFNKTVWAFIAILALTAQAHALKQPPRIPILTGSRGGGEGPFPPYTGEVGGNVTIANSHFGGFTQAMSRSCHFIRGAAGYPVFIYGNFYDAGSGETASGAATTITLGLEYPVGSTPVRVTWSGGSTSGTIPNLVPGVSGGYLASDPSPLYIPNNALFCLRPYETNSAGVPWDGGPKNNVYGEALALNSSGVVDMSLGGTIPNTNTNATSSALRPIAIIGTTTQSTIQEDGDSRAFGYADLYDSANAIGDIDRSLAPFYATQNYGVDSARAGDFIASHYVRVQMAAYVKNIISEFGSNDMITRSTGTAAALEANQQTIAGYFPGKGFYLTTIEPDVVTTQSVSSLASVSTLATATVLSTANYYNGEPLGISGASPSAYNSGVTGIGVGGVPSNPSTGGFAITVIAPTQFTYTFAGGTSPATGTIIAADNGATLALQAPYAGAAPEAQRVIYNTALRAGPLGSWQTGFFDIASAVESSLNSGKWIVNGTPQYVVWDGVHETSTGTIIIQNSGVISSGIFK